MPPLHSVASYLCVLLEVAVRMSLGRQGVCTEGGPKSVSKGEVTVFSVVPPLGKQKRGFQQMALHVVRQKEDKQA